MNKKLSIIVLFSLIVLSSIVPLHAQWAKIYGGSDRENALSIHHTSDGGYIVAGYTESFGAGENDAWVLKLNSNGDIEWQRTYGGSDTERAHSIQQTSDGGYIVAGETHSYGAGSWDWDFWILKLTSNGDIEWQRTYGGDSEEIAYSIQQTSDGGYVVTGETWSFIDVDLCDIWILKLNSNGDIQWQRTYGGMLHDYAYSVQQTSYGGYIVAGGTESSGAGGSDAWILKLDSTGDPVWSRTYGGSEGDFWYNLHHAFPKSPSFQQTSDGGYIAAGYTESFGAGGVDAWILKLSSDGNIEWQKTYGGEAYDYAYSIDQTDDGGYVVAGETYSPWHSVWLIKLSSNGDVEWSRAYGGEEAHAIQETSDGGYIVAGQGHLMDELTDFFILKLDSNGDIPPYCWLEESPDVSVSDTNVSTVITFFGTLTWTNASPSTTNCSTQDTNALVTLLCPGYILSITSTDGGTTDPPGPHPCSIGEEVQIEAMPETDYRFKGWTGDVPEGHENDNPVTITMDSDKNIHAKFDNLYMLTIAARPGGTTNPQPGDYEYVIREEVSVEAIAHDEWQFIGWSGAASGTTNPITITMDSDKSITANFTATAGDGDEDGKGSGCFIATVAYGSPLHPHVDILRDFRDKYLMPTKAGRAFVNLYYKYSPYVADAIAKHKSFRVIAQINLMPWIILSYAMVHSGPIHAIAILLLVLGLLKPLVLFYRRNRDD